MPVIKEKDTNQKIEEWFDEFISRLKIDQLELTTNTCDKKKKEFYSDIMNSNATPIIKRTREASTEYFIGKILNDYFSILNTINSKPLSISVDLDNSGLLIWAIINDDDYQAEKDLFLTEAKINSIYSDFGFHIDTMIVEKCDEYPAPSHYKSVIANA